MTAAEIREKIEVRCRDGAQASGLISKLIGVRDCAKYVVGRVRQANLVLWDMHLRTPTVQPATTSSCSISISSRRAVRATVLVLESGEV